jgi:putative addiction module CopG family antidote
MAYALAKEQEQFIDRMVHQGGGYNNQSEVVREALRRIIESHGWDAL